MPYLTMLEPADVLPGLGYTEITREQAAELYWRIAALVLDPTASGRMTTAITAEGGPGSIDATITGTSDAWTDETSGDPARYLLRPGHESDLIAGYPKHTTSGSIRAQMTQESHPYSEGWDLESPDWRSGGSGATSELRCNPLTIWGGETYPYPPIFGWRLYGVWDSGAMHYYLHPAGTLLPFVGAIATTDHTATETLDLDGELEQEYEFTYGMGLHVEMFLADPGPGTDVASEWVPYTTIPDDPETEGDESGEILAYYTDAIKYSTPVEIEAAIRLKLNSGDVDIPAWYRVRATASCDLEAFADDPPSAGPPTISTLTAAISLSAPIEYKIGLAMEYGGIYDPETGVPV